MKIKTIKRVISQKLNAWISTLPTHLQDDVRDNVVVSGGSIASLLLQEPVNDYDVYIQDINVLKRLTQYYCDFHSIKVLDGNLKQQYLDRLAGDEMYENTEYGENVSERAVRIKSLHPGQIKIDIDGGGYAPDLIHEKTNVLQGDKKSSVTYNNFKEIPDNVYIPLFFSQNAISLSNDIQIVTRFSGTIEEIHKSFDFIHATNYFTFKKGLVTNTDALESLMTKELRYQGSLYPLTSVIRMKKFIARKWTMNAGEVLKMLFQCADLDLRNPIVLEEQLIGVDIAYFSALIEAIRKTNPTKLNPSYMNKIIDRVFSKYDGDD
jgi:hypothetical protein